MQGIKSLGRLFTVGNGTKYSEILTWAGLAFRKTTTLT